MNFIGVAMKSHNFLNNTVIKQYAYTKNSNSIIVNEFYRLIIHMQNYKSISKHKKSVGRV